MTQEAAHKTWLKELQAAFMLLSRLPAGRLQDPVPPMGHAVWAYPFVGCVIGILASLVLVGLVWLGAPPEFAAGFALCGAILATGALHEDGLADVADGFGGGQDPARKLEIMRDSRIGSYGTLALIASFALRWMGLSLIARVDLGLAVACMIALAMASRATMALALSMMPAARSDGLGASSANAPLAKGVIAVGGAGVFSVILLGVWPAIVLLLSLAAVTWLCALIALRQIGGQTGDVMGSVQQISEIAGWLVLSMMVLP